MVSRIISRKSALAVAVAVSLGSISLANAQEAADKENVDEVIEVTGIRTALANALNEKRASSNIKEVIQAEDIGKLPDNNLAEVLENITGVQIDRTNGVGTSVQIRGTGANRVEINGVSSVSSGAGRTGISFEDLPAALISSLEVTKAPTAKTIEGSVGGTINLRTLRGNSLKKRLVQVRAQSETSDLADSTTPKISGTFGDNWETDYGKLGVVVTGSYAEQDVASANPRFDRDRVVQPGSSPSDMGRTNPFFRTQFLDQPLNGRKYETKNLTTSIELQASDDLKVYFDATINDQESVNNNNRVFFSGTGGQQAIDATRNTGFDTIDLGSLDGRFGTIDLGSVDVVTSGIIGVGVNGSNSIEPNLRTGNSNSARETTSRVFALGTEYTGENYQLKAELSYSDSESSNPSLNSGLDFINPKGPQVTADTSTDNGTPAEFKLVGNTFQFGIAQGRPETPTTADLLNPANYALRSIGEGLRNREATEAAARVDLTYNIADSVPLFTDLHVGARWNKTTNTTNNQSSSNSFQGAWNRPRADLFSDIIVPASNNFGGADGRELFIADYLIIDNNISFKDPEFVKKTINNAIATNNALQGTTVNPLLTEPEIQSTQFFDIEEENIALYVQGDYEFEVGDVYVNGNLGARYVTTDLNSLGNNLINGEVTQSEASTSYDFILPRFNINAEVFDGTFVRAGIGKDIRRPDFDDLSTSATFPTGANAAVTVGNPGLEPEEIWSADLSIEHYISSSAFVSVGLFYKERKNLHVLQEESPAEPIGPGGQIERDTTAPCEDGGIYNPNVAWENFGVWSSVEGTDGICVARRSTLNAEGTETQRGIEIAGQYDLSEFEDELGWASGFGVIANYTFQKAGGGLETFDLPTSDSQAAKGIFNAIDQITGRTDYNNSTPTTADDTVSKRAELEDLSENAYNITLFYDKYDWSVRMRYTWRDSFVERLGRNRFNIPPVVGARGQLNMSVSYDINEHFTVGVEGVNLTQDDRTRWCFNEGTLLCEQSLTDRRITLGVTAKL